MCNTKFFNMMHSMKILNYIEIFCLIYSYFETLLRPSLHIMFDIFWYRKIDGKSGDSLIKIICYKLGY